MDMSEWISVKDRLPNYNIEVVTRTMAGGLAINVYLIGKSIYRDHWQVSHDYVTHWMPLPDPPRR